MSVVSLVCLQLEAMVLGSIKLSIAESLYYTCIYNLALLAACIRYLNFEPLRIARTEHGPLYLRTVFGVMAVICFTASAQLLSASYATLLLFCGAFISPGLASTELSETSTVADKWTIGMGVFCAAIYLLPVSAVRST